MRCLQACTAGLALVLSIGFLQGCDMNAPKEPTQTQVLKADAKSQEAMKQYYGNMIGPQSKAKSTHKPK
jgi:hypothetical protein